VEEHGERRTLLVVDDDSRILQVLGSMLESMGYEVIGVQDGREAIGVFEAIGARCDAVLTDLKMPGLSGSDLIAILRAHRPGLPALLMTGVSGAIATDAPVLRKPFGFADLQTGLSEAFSASPHSSIRGVTRS